MFRQFIKTRLAPTPSGFLHLGNVLSFSITTALAQKSNAEILLRIDDLDQARADIRFLRDIFDTLRFLGIPWSAGPRDAEDFNENYSQVYRLGLYEDALARLAETKMVFACSCSRKDLQAAGHCNCENKHIPLNTEGTCWRLITRHCPELTVRRYDGAIVRGGLPDEMHNFVVKKKDGFPAYQLASVVDDLFYGVDLVVRGQDLWPSTLAQHVLAAALGKDRFSEIAFLHHPLLAEQSGLKMSKSSGATSVKYLRESGKTKAEVFEMAGDLLGYTQKVRSWQELGEAFIRG